LDLGRRSRQPNLLLKFATLNNQASLTGKLLRR
jgi:hypothetical protein